MIARISGAPSGPTATVPDHCDVHPTPMKSAGGTAAPARASWAAEQIADHQSAGSCSAPPPARR